MARTTSLETTPYSDTQGVLLLNCFDFEFDIVMKYLTFIGKNWKAARDRKLDCNFVVSINFVFLLSCPSTHPHRYTPFVICNPIYFLHYFPIWTCLKFISATILAFGSTNLLHQVPNSSIITWFIIPPHRLAFERTISVIGYLNLRLVHQWIQQQKHLLDWLFSPKLTGNNTGNNGWISLLFPIGLLFYQTHQFFPLHLDYCNGNTYVFVIPMWIGLLVDCIHQFPVIGKIDRSSMVLLLHWRDNMSSIQSHLNSSEVWEKVNYWNENIVDVHYLILTLLCALQVAFMFSVSFRGHLDIRICYWIAALVVGFLCIRLGNSISA